MNARHSSLLCMAALLLTSCVSQSIEHAPAPALPTAQVAEKSPASPQPAAGAAPQPTAVPQPTAHPSNEPLVATATPALPTSSPEVLPTAEAPDPRRLTPATHLGRVPATSADRSPSREARRLPRLLLLRLTVSEAETYPARGKGIVRSLFPCGWDRKNDAPRLVRGGEACRN